MALVTRCIKMFKVLDSYNITNKWQRISKVDILKRRKIEKVKNKKGFSEIEKEILKKKIKEIKKLI